MFLAGKLAITGRRPQRTTSSIASRSIAAMELAALVNGGDQMMAGFEASGVEAEILRHRFQFVLGKLGQLMRMGAAVETVGRVRGRGAGMTIGA